MKKSLINLFCSLIPSRPVRKAVRFRLMEYSPKLDRENIRLFCEQPVPQRAVLLVEPSVTHGEVTTGFAKYWLDLGYWVDVLLHEEVARDNPFCRFSHEKLRLFRHSYGSFKALVTHPRVADYDVVFFTTPFYARWQEKDHSLHSLHDYAAYKPQGSKATFVVEHDLSNIAPYHEKPLLTEGKLVTLADFKVDGHRTVMANPHYFGEVPITRKNRPTRFVVAGAFDPKRKNHSLLLQAAQSLLSQGRDDFSITIIGSGRKNQTAMRRLMPGGMEKHFTFTGRVNFPDMYRHMDEAHFFLPLLDPAIPAHQRYITTGVSGSYQLMLGFHIPWLVEHTFTAFYRLTPANSIIYTGTALAAAMKQAMDMPEHEYAHMQSAVGLLSGELHRESMQNLSEALERQQRLRQPTTAMLHA